MVNRWLSLLLGVALLQGVLSFGPIDETDEEWIAYRNMMSNPDYRLPRTTEPEYYTVNLTPHLKYNETPTTFEGDVTIEIKALQSVQQIQLHCNDLTIDPNSVSVALKTNPAVNIIATTGQDYTCTTESFLKINTAQPLQVGDTIRYIVKMSFTGRLQTNMRGFYRSWYYDENRERRWMATTQFQPGHARQAFPCYDEPSFKANFTISMTREDEGFSPTISNMPIQNTERLADGKIKETFYPTPRTSTYLLAFIVSGYTRRASNNQDLRPFHIYARSNIPTSHAAYSLAVGMPLLQEMERYTDISYYGMQANMEMKQAAIPDFSAGAMENWGLLTYREALIIYDPENTNNFYKQRIANIISHEIAHMWFGNLVTCDWWDNLWLNEGFARFYQYFLTNEVEKDFGFDTRFIVEQVQVSLLSDSIPSAHPLTDTSVSSPTTVSNHFSQITYGKGAAVLRMTQYLLGKDVYEAGLRKYLKDNAYKTAKPEDLFNALQSAVTEAGAATVWPYAGTTVTNYFSSWSTQGGHPLLNVTVNRAEGLIVVQQGRFFREASEAVTNTQTWHVPITWTRESNPDFDNLKPTDILTDTQRVYVTDIGNEWVIFNKQQSGFYRVTYDEITWAHITRALRGEDRLKIHEYNRAQIVDDVFLLARFGTLTYRKALNILSFLEFEDAYAPWMAAITGFNFALRRLAHDNLATARLRAAILNLSTAVVARLGYQEPENGSFMDDLLRMNLMTFLCNVGDQRCVNAARTSFSNWRNGGRIPANMRPWVYCNGLRYGSAEDYDYFWSRYNNTDLANEQVVMIQAAGCTQHQPSLNRLLSNIVSTEETNFIVRAQDQSTAISSAITSNEYNTMRAFQWLQNNLERARAAGVLNSMLTTITGRLLTNLDITSIENWVNANSATLGESASQAARNGIANARTNLEFYKERLPEFNEYFEAGYDDYLNPSPVPETTTTPATTVTVPATQETTTTSETTTTEESTTPSPTTTPEPTTQPSTAPTTATEPTTTPAPDSANLATLSIVTLIVTLAINMA
ncbi:hypothetical protein PYW08_001429 [Mythimna loreyi]|uniref:Uncharacterized protein n=1 Tax=Mythimna loreyi TaxID=667449 RepID=A0ACC2R3Z5_9NEOP|nr:hypothetical protein PYW08_001429 [Mythimna loreyi]